MIYCICSFYVFFQKSLAETSRVRAHLSHQDIEIPKLSKSQLTLILNSATGASGRLFVLSIEFYFANYFGSSRLSVNVWMTILTRQTTMKRFPDTLAIDPLTSFGCKGPSASTSPWGDLT